MTFCFAKGGDCEDDRRLIAMRKAFLFAGVNVTTSQHGARR